MWDNLKFKQDSGEQRESYMLLFERIRYCKSVIVCMPLLGTTACIFRWWPSMSSQYFHHNTDQSILTSGALYDKMRCLVPLAHFNLSFPIWCLLLQIQFNGIFFSKISNRQNYDFSPRVHSSVTKHYTNHMHIAL